jgi:hypothetical protein
VPRFYFHIRDGEALEVDPQGVEFPSLESAILDARRAAREILAERLMEGETVDWQSFEITSEDGMFVEKLTFKSVLKLH